MHNAVTVNAWYDWWVTAVNKEGAEGYASVRENASAVYLKPILNYWRMWYEPNGSDFDGKYVGTPVIKLQSNVWGYYNAKEVKVWRDGTYLGEFNYLINSYYYDFADWDVQKGKTYQYKFVYVDYAGNETEPVTVTMKAETRKDEFDGFVASNCSIALYLRQGNTPVISFTTQEDAVFRLYRNDVLIKTYSKSAALLRNINLWQRFLPERTAAAGPIRMWKTERSMFTV